jgi:hypothetical protein
MGIARVHMEGPSTKKNFCEKLFIKNLHLNMQTSFKSGDELLVGAAESPFNIFDVVLRLSLRPLNESFMTKEYKI